MRKPPRIAPSILAADFAHLGDEVQGVTGAADMLHVDVMDGHFVPNISLGIPVIESLGRVTDLYLDCHLMTTNPTAFLPELRKAGANLVTMHIEAVPDPTDAARQAREAGLDYGLVVNPPTPFEAIAPFVELCDLVLVMSVNPGFGGQAFIPEVLDKVRAARNLVDSRGLATDIQIDGGITTDTAAAARAAGADVFVAGTAVFGADDPAAAIADLRAAVASADKA